MKTERYQTYVFDRTPDVEPVFDPKYRDVLGPEYKGGVPCAWSASNALRDKSKLEEFVRRLRDEGHNHTGEDIADMAEALMEELNFG